MPNIIIKILFYNKIIIIILLKIKIKKMAEQEKQLVYSKGVLEMITVANEYCLFVESAEKYSKEIILDYLQKICPLLYLKGSLLPDIKISDENANERYLTEENWLKIFNILREKFDNSDEYWELLEDEIEGVKPIKARLSDNFADVYQDLKDFILLYQKNTIAAKENAVMECKKQFGNHWGERIIKAHKIIHDIIYKESSNFENQS